MSRFIANFPKSNNYKIQILTKMKRNSVFRCHNWMRNGYCWPKHRRDRTGQVHGAQHSGVPPRSLRHSLPWCSQSLEKADGMHPQETVPHAFACEQFWNVLVERNLIHFFSPSVSLKDLFPRLFHWTPFATSWNTFKEWHRREKALSLLADSIFIVFHKS